MAAKNILSDKTPFPPKNETVIRYRIGGKKAKFLRA